MEMFRYVRFAGGKIYRNVKEHFKYFRCLFDGSHMIGTAALKKLDEKRYESALKKQNAIAFKALVLRLYMSALNGTSASDSIITKCKKIIYYLLNKRSLYDGSENYRMSVLKRLTENETYRFLTISAIEDKLQGNGSEL